jgi:hypothetical protein
LRQYARDDVLLADMRLAHVLDADPRFRRHGRRCLADPFAQCLGELGVVEDADPVRVEISRHAIGIANRRQCPGDHQPVVT